MKRLRTHLIALLAVALTCTTAIDASGYVQGGGGGGAGGGAGGGTGGGAGGGAGTGGGAGGSQGSQGGAGGSSGGGQGSGGQSGGSQGGGAGSQGGGSQGQQGGGQGSGGAQGQQGGGGQGAGSSQGQQDGQGGGSSQGQQGGGGQGQQGQGAGGAQGNAGQGQGSQGQGGQGQGAPQGGNSQGQGGNGQGGGGSQGQGQGAPGASQGGGVLGTGGAKNAQGQGTNTSGPGGAQGLVPGSSSPSGNTFQPSSNPFGQSAADQVAAEALGLQSQSTGAAGQGGAQAQGGAAQSGGQGQPGAGGSTGQQGGGQSAGQNAGNAQGGQNAGNGQTAGNAQGNAGGQGQGGGAQSGSSTNSGSGGFADPANGFQAGADRAQGGAGTANGLSGGGAQPSQASGGGVSGGSGAGDGGGSASGGGQGSGAAADSGSGASASGQRDEGFGPFWTWSDTDSRWSRQPGGRDGAGTFAFRGKIETFQTLTAQGRNVEHTFVRLRLDDGQLALVDLGPRANLDTFDVKPGSIVEVRGERGEIAGTPILVTRSLRASTKPGNTTPVTADAPRELVQDALGAVVLDGPVESVRPASIVGSVAPSTIYRVELGNGKEHLVDMGPRANPQDFDLQRGAWISIRGQTMEIAGNDVLVANVVSVDGKVRIGADHATSSPETGGGRNETMPREASAPRAGTGGAQTGGQNGGARESGGRDDQSRASPGPARGAGDAVPANRGRDAQTDRAGKVHTFAVVANSERFLPTTMSVRPGERVRLSIQNLGDRPFSIAFRLPDGTVTLDRDLAPDATGTFEFAAPDRPGRYEFFNPLEPEASRTTRGELVVAD